MHIERIFESTPQGSKLPKLADAIHLSKGKGGKVPRLGGDHMSNFINGEQGERRGRLTRSLKGRGSEGGKDTLGFDHGLAKEREKKPTRSCFRGSLEGV